MTTLTWSAPGEPVVGYDTLQATSPNGFASATCVETQGTDTQSVVSATPAVDAVFYYLTRATNPCGNGSAGASSTGVPRSARDCP